MDRNEALWIAISALEWVINMCVSGTSPDDAVGQEHIAEKREALELLKEEVK